MNTSNISALRKAKGWTQERLSTESGVAVRTIQRLESGQDANLETLRLLAQALDVEVSDLFSTVEKVETKKVIDTFDAQKAAQSRRRDEEYKIYKRWLNLGLNIVMLVLLVAVYSIYMGSHFSGIWIVWPVWGLLWAVGAQAVKTYLKVKLPDKLDAKYPLTQGLDVGESQGGKNE